MDIAEQEVINDISKGLNAGRIEPLKKVQNNKIANVTGSV